MRHKTIILSVVFVFAIGFMNLNAQTNTVTDVDGNVYKTIKIGNQEWMVENLKTTRFNDSSNIPLVENPADWAKLSTPACCWYENNATDYKNTHGALYNWYAVNTGKLAPAGWRVASDGDWTTLVTYLGGENEAGSKLKENGFNALASGYRNLDGKFSGMGDFVYWWSSTENLTGNAWVHSMYFKYSRVYNDNRTKGLGHSVRCVKN